MRAGSPRANSSSTTNQRQLRRIWTPYYGGTGGVVITSSQPSLQEIEEIIAAIVIISYGGTVYWLKGVHPAIVGQKLTEYLIRVIRVLLVSSGGYEGEWEGGVAQDGFHRFEFVF